jgi:hypothetical protein
MAQDSPLLIIALFLAVVAAVSSDLTARDTLRGFVAQQLTSLYEAEPGALPEDARTIGVLGP